ncbi:MAG: hypothetical protein LBL15_01460 [Oscillospiraceae bacterium]|jgi:hypothetical protein|nr:hypothetical protein [Oscillospiraceae bacterium]
MEKPNIQVDIPEAYRYMGGCGAPDETVAAELRRAAELIERAVSPRSISRVCGIERSAGLSLSETGLSLTGKTVAALLHDCESCVIFCATAGSGIESLLRSWQLRSLAFAAMLDACASSAVEALCSAVETALRADFSRRGLYLTDRFSPGYGDLPIAIQPAFCAALDTTRKIGVSVGENGIMIPRKSVTALIGVSKNPQKHYDTGCFGCLSADSCKFRANGVSCYGQLI